MFKVRSFQVFILFVLTLTTSCHQEDNREENSREYFELSATTIDSFLMETIPDRLLISVDERNFHVFNKISTNEWIEVKVLKVDSGSQLKDLAQGALQKIVSKSVGQVKPLDKFDFEGRSAVIKFQLQAYGDIVEYNYWIACRLVEEQLIQLIAKCPKENGQLEKDLKKVLDSFVNL